MEVVITFEGGKMNSDVSKEILPKGEHISSKNIDFFSGSAIPMKGMSVLTDNNLSKAKSLGELASPAEDKIYYFYTATSDEGLIEYDVSNDTIKFILRSLTGKLNLKKIKKINRVDDLIFFTDGVNPPRRVDRTVTYATDGFSEKDISVIKPAPLKAPRIVMSDNLSGENNLKDKFVQFASRNKYITGEYSAISPFSKLAFLPKSFDYNYSTHTNNGMINTFNSVEINFDTGNELVEEVQLLFKETGSNAVYVIDEFNKEELGYLDNETQTHVFVNNKKHKVLPTDQLVRMFDNVPLLAGAQEIIGNRLVYADYTDGYNFEDSLGAPVELKHSVELISEDTATTINPKDSAKTNRDYEFAIVYSDDQTRMATPAVSKTNTVFIPTSVADNTNRFKVTIPHKAPAFANSYRFFVKESKIDYDVIIPSLFYEDNVFVWVKYEEADKEKITVGDYLLVKRDTSGDLLTSNIEVKILEAGYKESNFLRPDLTGDENEDAELRKINNEAGYYFKIKPERFVMDISDLETLEDSVYHNTRVLYDNNIFNEDVTIQCSVYGESIDDITCGGSYLPPTTTDILDWDFKGNQQDVRFKVTIDTGGTSFSWTCDAEVTTPPSGGPTAIPQAGGTFSLAYGVNIVFPNRTLTGTYPYEAGEYINVSAKTRLYDDASGNRALACLQGFEGNEVVEGGAQILIWVKEYGGTSESVLYDTFYSEISSRQYDNLEEWWYEDGINLANVEGKYIFFRRGYKTKNDSSYKFYEDNTKDADGNYNYAMHIFIRGQVAGASGNKRRGKIASSIKIVQTTDSNSFPIFETRPVQEIDNDLFFEIGDTYLIDEDGNHLGDTSLHADDVNQVFDTTDAEINIRYSNCYSFGNGVESYKIRDGFNENKIKLDARALKPIEDYKQIRNESDLIWSGAFSKSTSVNKLNEFNLATINFKELSTKQDGPIRKIATRKGDLIILQDSLVSKVLFGRTLLSSIDGTQVVGSSDILGAQTFYSKKFGIGNNPESYAEYGNNFYFADPRNGTFVRGGYSGLDEIVDGLKYELKDKLRCNTGELNAVYDLRKDSYIVNINGVLHYFKESSLGWTTTVERNVDSMLSMNDRTFGFINGDIYEFYTGDFIGGSIKTVINDFPNETKTFEALKLNSNEPLDIMVSTDENFSTIKNYEKREDFYHGYIPKALISSSNKYGLGVVDSVSGKEIKMVKPFNEGITIGDTLENDNGIIGTILSVSNDIITVSTKSIPVIPGSFVLGGKDSSIEGDTVRGKCAVIDISFEPGKDHKLLTITADIDKSFN